MEGISNKIIDAAIIEKSQLALTKINSTIRIVSEFPLNEYFYKKQIQNINWNRNNVSTIFN